MHEEFLRRAIQLAAENAGQGRGGPFGAVIVMNGEIIAEGANHVTTDLDPTAHAEIVAIRAACRRLGRFDLRGAAIYSSCEPCPMCLGAIYWARLDALYYAAGREDAAQAGFDDRFLYEQFALDEQKRSLPTRRIALPEAAEPFAVWLRHPGRVPY
ncbi:MAG: nucleoside deaminase [Bryobacteraceae bacterium]|nr:nucleoside deaminase [Bryobacteraceae bacterium]